MRPLFFSNNSLIKLILVVGSILFFTAGALIYVSEKSILDKEAKLRLDQAIAIDVSKRLKEANDNIVFGYYTNDIFTNSFIENDSSIILPDENQYKKSPVNTRLQLVMQSYLLDKNPINICILDSIYQSDLIQNSIRANVALRYINNITNGVTDSKPNSKLYISSYALDEISLGLQSEITIQGFVKLSPLTIISKAKRQFAIVYSILLLLTGILMYIVSRRKIGYIVPTTGEYNITKDISFDMDKLSLRYKDENIALTPQSAKILKLLLISPDYFIGYEELGNTMWGNLEKARDRRDKAINRLRESLESIPNLHIACIWTNGYQLIIGSKQDAEKAEKATNCDHPANKADKPKSFIKRFLVSCKLPFLQH